MSCKILEAQVRVGCLSFQCKAHLLRFVGVVCDDLAMQQRPWNLHP